MTPGIKGFKLSLTNACKTWLSNGRFILALDINTLDDPATAQPILLAKISPLLVSTPMQVPDLILNPVTSQFCMISTPNSSAA